VSIDPVKDPMNNARIQGNANNPYRVNTPEVGRLAPKISLEKSGAEDQVNPARSPYLNVTQTISRTMNQLNTEQRGFILDQYTKTDAVLDKLGDYR
jgi:hypothetical protein